MTTTELRRLLAEALEAEGLERGLDLDSTSFADDGLLTRDEGLTVRVGDHEFQLTIVQTC